MTHGHHSKETTHATDADITKLSEIAGLDQLKDPSLLGTKIIQLLCIALKMQHNEESKFLCGTESTHVIQLYDLQAACEKQGYNYSELKKVADGEATEHCGWRLIEQLLTPNQAKNLVERIQLFSWLRNTAVSHQLLARFCRKLPSKHSSMPSWWKRGEHDIELIKLVAKHGLDCQFWTREPFAAHVVGTPDTDSADFQERTPKEHFVWSRLVKLHKTLPKKASFVPLPVTSSKNNTKGGVKDNSNMKKSTKRLGPGSSPNKRSNPWQRMSDKATQQQPQADSDSDDDDFRKPVAKKTKLQVQCPEGCKPKVAEVSTEASKPKVAEVSTVPTANGKAKTKQQHVAATQSRDQTAAAVAVLEEMCPEDKAAALAAMPYQERAAALAVMQCDKQLNAQSTTTVQTNADNQSGPNAKGEGLTSRELIKRAQMQRALGKRAHSEELNDPETTITSLSVPLLNEAGLAVGTPHANSSGLTNESNSKLLPEKSFEKLAKPKQASAVTEVVKSADVAVKKRKLAVTKPALSSGMRSLTTFFNRVAPK